MFYAIYEELCRLRGESPSRAADNMGINRATVTCWKKEGFSPRQATLNKVATYHAVPPAYLLGEIDDPCPICGGSGASHAASHAQFLAAAEKWGFCWHEALCVQKIAAAQTVLTTGDDWTERMAALTGWLSAAFSRSLRASGFAPDHPSAPFFFGQALAVCPPSDWLAANEIAHARARYPAPRRLWAGFTPLRWDTAPAPSVDLLPPPPTVGHIPLLGRIAAGSPLIARQHIVDWIPTSHTPDDGTFALRVQGDSMIGAGIYPDAIAILQQCPPREGQIVACLLDGEDVTLKRVKFTPEGVWLIPENPAYAPRLVPAADFETGRAAFLGVLTEVRLAF